MSLHMLLSVLAFVNPFADGFAAPTDIDNFDHTGLTAPSTIALNSEEGERRLVAIAAVLDEELSRTDRTRLGAKVLSKKRITIATGAFAGGDAIVTVNVDLRAKDPEAAPKFISGVFTIDAAGDLAATIVPMQTRTERFELLGTGDVDGDGATDLVFAKTGPESTTTHLVSWTDAAPTDRELLPQS